MSEPSSIYLLPSERLRAFAALRALGAVDQSQGATAAQLSDFLRDQCGVAISRQRVTALLSKERAAVARRRIRAQQHYKLMKVGAAELDTLGQATIFIEPESGLTKIRQVEDIFGSLTGVVRICDPYADNRSLDILAQARRADEIRFLTATITRETAFRRDFAAFKNEHGNRLGIRISKYPLHDRYLISGNGVWFIGTSLNGLGRKQSFIVPLGTDFKSMALPAFDRIWNTAEGFK